VAATTQNRKTHWTNWTRYVRPLGLDPFVQGIKYTTKVCALTGFAARVRQGLFGRGKRVATGTVIGAITAIGQEVVLVCGRNPTTILRSDKLLPRLSQTPGQMAKGRPTNDETAPRRGRCPRTPLRTRTGRHREQSRPSNRGSHTYRFLLPPAHRRVHNKGDTQRKKSNGPIQIRGHHLLQEE